MCKQEDLSSDTQHPRKTLITMDIGRDFAWGSQTVYQSPGTDSLGPCRRQAERCLFQELCGTWSLQSGGKSGRDVPRRPLYPALLLTCSRLNSVPWAGEREKGSWHGLADGGLHHLVPPTPCLSASHYCGNIFLEAWALLSFITQLRAIVKS